MRKASSKNSEALPSLLDRITDDSHLTAMLEKSKQQVTTLEKKLSSHSSDVIDETKRTWERELKTHKRQLLYLQSTTRSLDRLMDCVKRDLSWLLNTQNLCMDAELDEKYPNIESSVLNYGMPDLSGKTLSGIKLFQLTKKIKQVILRFEPRIIPKTLNVILHADDSDIDKNALIFIISGDLLAEPVPIHLQLMTQLDLESGDVEVNEFI